MRRLTTAVLGVIAVACWTTATADADSCPADSVKVRNVLLFNECYCRSHDYPELKPILERLGLYLDRPGKSAWNEQVRGKTWYYCSINLRWVDRTRRSDPAACGKDNRKRIVQEVKQALEHPVAINSPFLSCR